MLRPSLLVSVRQLYSVSRQCFSTCGRMLNEDGYVSVKDFYKGKSVFITGATGFVGQGLIEKLLRSCPDIHRIYIPIRAKDNGDPYQRYQKLLKNKVFDSLRATNSNIEKKLVPLPAVLEESTLGISDEIFHKIKDEISVVFHVAALVKLNPPLKDAVDSNVLVARNVYRFGKQCPNLEAYIHVSSLYTHVDLDYIEEKMYPTKWDPDQLLQMNRWKRLMNYKRIVGKSPGTYFATKKVGEYLTVLEGVSAPVGILRLGKVCPSLKEPVPGWSHGFASYISWMKMIDRGDVAMLIGATHTKDEMIPADLCCNSLITTAWYLGTNQAGRKTDPFIVHVQSNPLDPYNTQDFVDSVNRYLQSEGRPANVELMSSKLTCIRRLAIPTLIQTFQEVIRGEKPWNFLMYMFFMIDKGVSTVQFKNNRKQHGNLDKIDNSLSEQDREEFPTDILQMNWDEYVATWLNTLKKTREDREMKAKIQLKQAD